MQRAICVWFLQLFGVYAGVIILKNANLKGLFGYKGDYLDLSLHRHHSDESGDFSNTRSEPRTPPAHIPSKKKHKKNTWVFPKIGVP